MKDRVVSRLMLDERDEISFLLGPWGAVTSEKAIAEIEREARRYHVLLADGFLVEIHVVREGNTKRLRADCEDAPENQLGGVPTLGR